jgi:hypothetical protein
LKESKFVSVKTLTNSSMEVVVSVDMGCSQLVESVSQKSLQRSSQNPNASYFQISIQIRNYAGVKVTSFLSIKMELSKAVLVQLKVVFSVFPSITSLLQTTMK